MNLVVYSSAIPKDNPELEKARELKIPTLHRSEFLMMLAEGKKLIAVAGTHGKTSTTAMIAHILDFCGYSPSAFIGGEVLGKKASSYTGQGEYFIAEVDESDGTILNFSPFLSVINNIDLDHLDHYRDIDHIKETFVQFYKQTDEEAGSLVFGWDNLNSREIGLGFADANRLGFDAASDAIFVEFHFKPIAMALSSLLWLKEIGSRV